MAGDAGSSADAQDAQGFTGLWSTTYGAMRLVADGSSVRGSYSWGGGALVEGVCEGRVLRATYTESDGTLGRAVFELSPDGESFRGRWRAGLERPLEAGDRDAGRWSGTRVASVPGRTWLVILEANWETSLDEHEYSYGAMLRAFFERAPSIQVRHRFFHDRADLERFCREVAYLAEPVVLYVSSHGTTAGVAVAGQTIDGTTIGRALREAGTLALLHFGSCEVLAGAEPAALRAAAGPRRFPISGFRETVDWAASAIVDFAYLSLVLEGGLTPDEAVQATRSMIRFAGAPGPELALPPADLVLW